MEVFSSCSRVISEALDRRRCCCCCWGSCWPLFLKETVLVGVNVPLPRSDRARWNVLGLPGVSPRGGVVVTTAEDLIMLF